ncbi:MAG TPA: WHG domain-containing protein, partial [Spirochaetes bacterium]|nr:WHG domain-containing protein [Spirochaetota bacterium]
GNRILSLVAGVIEAGIEDGEFRKVDAKKCSIILWGTLHGLIQLRKLGDTILKDEIFSELYDYGVRCFINGFSVRPVPAGPH